MKNPEKVAGLITELKSLADNQFELHRINVLEKDLFNPPKPQVIDDNHQKFDGINYYISKGSRGDLHLISSHQPLHRAVYNYYFGNIPDNFVIHHIDSNPANNNIENLQLLTRNQHIKIHNSESYSADKVSLAKCKNCHKDFFSSKLRRHYFCCDSCRREYYHKKEKVYEKICKQCGKTFFTRTEKSRFCSLKCYAESSRNVLSSDKNVSASCSNRTATTDGISNTSSFYPINENC